MASGLFKMKDKLVFDIETQKSFEEVGGKENLHLLGISVLAAYSYRRGKTFVFEEKNLNQFQKMLEETGTLIGFNINSFDIPILKRYNFNLSEIVSLDLMDDIVKGTGFRVALDNVAKTTLNVSKSADGLQAIKWFKEGNIENIKKYCVKDVLITKDIYEYGKNNSHILFLDRNKQRIAVPVFWGGSPKNIRQILEEALRERRSVEIDYITHYPQSKNDSAKNSRLVDIRAINNSILEGYCHLRKADRIFKIDKILKAKITDRSYNLPSDVQGKLI